MPRGPVSAAFEHSWAKLYRFVLGALGLPVWCLESSLTFFGRIDKIHFHRGKVGLGAYLKEAQRVLLHHLAGHPVSETTVGLKKGLPRILPGVIRKGVLEGDVAALRTALTFFSFVRVIFHAGVIKFSTITDPATWTPSPSKQNRWSKEIRLALKWLQVPVWVADAEAKKAGFHKSNRQGPNGHATLAAHWDALALRESDLWETFKGMCILFGLPSLIAKVDALALVTGSAVVKAPWLTSMLSSKTGKPLLGKLAVKDEPCGKKRLFAISDYWTQSICKPLHEYLMRVLRKLPMDGTWDQGRAAERVRIWSGQGKKLYCFDLSAATDRFPRLFTVLVLGCLIGVAAAEGWATLLTSRSYSYKGAAYRYAAGQPMGTLSSWAAFALSHHVVVQIAAARAGFTGLFTGYVLLGDDIVIADADVAEEYQEIMTILGVTINLSKSLVGVGLAEFAKRHFWHGHEITGLSGSLIKLAGTHLSGLRVLVDVARLRGWAISAVTIVASIAMLVPLKVQASRAWRFILVSVLGPGGPLSVSPALWGGLLTAASAHLLGTLQGTISRFSRLPPLQSDSESRPDVSLVGPLESEHGLVEEIYRHFEIQRIRHARESHARWIELLLGSLPSLIKGWVLMGPEKKASGDFYPSRLDSLSGFGRALIEVGHPASQESAMTEELQTEHSEMELMDLSIQLSKGDRLVPAVWGLAPSGDLALLQRARQDTLWGFKVIKTIRATLPLAFEWREPGALEMIREGLLLEIGELPLAEAVSKEG